MLVIADHGKGWEGLIQDDSHKGWMSVPQLRQALDTAQKATGQKLDVLGFDACQMASVEVQRDQRLRQVYGCVPRLWKVARVGHTLIF